jgi:type I restriction enzyme M protein
LVVDDQWIGAHGFAEHTELDRVSQTLTRRFRQVADRHATPLPQLEDEVNAFARRVEGHLKKMGSAWK